MALILACTSKARAADETMAGPLRACPTNPRYFTNDTGRPVYLTGFHTWDTLRDSGPQDPPKPFDYDGYLRTLARLNHNFIRLWAWDQPRSQCGTDPVHQTRPMPWLRTGPGLANDGKPKFDLSRLDDSYFERLRSRVAAARDKGIYVSIMLFEGYGVQFYRKVPDGHPFDSGNNINGVDSAASALTTGNPKAWEVQMAYVHRVVDTVNDLDNVLYEIINEAGGNSVPWQFAVIDALNDYQKRKPNRHPVGMTFAWQGGDNPTLFASPADWISPGGGADPYGIDPPAADGMKVIINDSDHIYGTLPDADFRWVWRSFTRGLQPILMDDMAGRPDQIGARAAMGHTLAYARRIDLAATTPRGDLTSTGYGLANPGKEYLVYQNKSGGFTVNMGNHGAKYLAEWFNPATGVASKAGSVDGSGEVSFKPPFDGPAVLHLRFTALAEP